MEWCSKLDTLRVKIPPLHFGQKSRGKLKIGTEIFDGSFEDLEKFVPKKLTRRMVVSKFWAIFDPFGKLTPETAKMKVDVSTAIKETEGWDAAVTPELRHKIVQNLWRLHTLKDTRYNRAVVPVDAVDPRKGHLLLAVDAAKKLKIVGVWIRFKRKHGKFSSQLLIGRSLLSKGGTLPQEELESMTIGSNLLSICRRALEGWIEDYSMFSDSVIAICWTTTEDKRLSLFHRNRVLQIRMHTDIEKIYHVRTDFNPADIGTRPSKVRDDDVGPQSIWETGFDWMHSEFDEAIKNDIIKPAKNLRLKTEEEEEFDRGLIFERTPEVLIRGHVTLKNARVSKMEERAIFSDYILDPTKMSFRKLIRSTAYLFKFLKIKWKGFSDFSDASSQDIQFKMFVVQFLEAGGICQEECSLSEYFSENSENVPRTHLVSTKPANKPGFKRTFKEDLEVTKKVLAKTFNKNTDENATVPCIYGELNDDDINAALYTIPYNPGMDYSLLRTADNCPIILL